MPGFELVDNKEKEAIAEIFDSKSRFRMGKRVSSFEKKFSNYIGSKYAVMFSSGTAAIKASLIACGIGKNDEVITQSFTFIAVVEAIIDIGAIPIVVDIDDTLNMCTKNLEKSITKKTKAIMPVHMLGVAADMDKINKIAKKYNLKIIDDNCESLGAKWGSKKLGIQSDICAWSFDNGKTITTGEGGMITTDSYKIYKLCHEYRDHGHQNNPKLPRGKDTHRIPGFNFRPTELNGALGISQLQKINILLRDNKAKYLIYKKIFSKIKILELRKIPSKCEPGYDCIIFNLPSKKIVEKVVKAMNQNNLITKNLPDAIEWHFAKYWDHIFKDLGYNKTTLKKKFLKSSKILEKSIAIPIFYNQSISQVQQNANLITKIINSISLENNLNKI